MDHSDPLTIHNKFTTTIGYNLDTINIVLMMANICNIIYLYSNITIIVGGAVEVGLFVYVVYSIIQAMNKSLLNIQLSFEFDAIIVAMDQLMSNFAVQSSIAAVCAYTHALHNVCAGFYSFFIYFLFCFCFFSDCICCIIDKVYKHKYTICMNKQFEHNLRNQLIQILSVSIFLLTVHQIVLHLRFEQVCNKVVKYITQQNNIHVIIMCIIIIIIYQRNSATIVRIVYIYILWLKENAVNIICINKLRTSSNSSNKLNQNTIIYHTLNKPIASMCTNKDYDELDANVDILDRIYQIPYEIGIFDSIIIIVNVSGIILCQIQTVMVVYAITDNACIFYDTILETVVYGFMLLLKFNTSSYRKDSPFFHSIATKIDNFDSNIAVINLTNKITAQANHSYAILIVIINELLIMIMDIHSANNIQSLSNDGETIVCTPQLHTNCSNGSKLNQNGIICCVLKTNITITFTIINCGKFVTNMCQMAQFYQINIPMHDLNPIITIMSVIDTITHQIGILINATYQYALNLSVELIDRSSLIITVSIRSNVITVAILQLNIKLAVQSSTNVAVCHAQVIHNVCAVLYFILSFFVFLLFVNVALFDTILILKIYMTTYRLSTS